MSKEMSHLTRGAWIEIEMLSKYFCLFSCRTSHEVRGLKFVRPPFVFVGRQGRTSHEVRGLKYNADMRLSVIVRVAPHTRCVD